MHVEIRSLEVEGGTGGTQDLRTFATLPSDYLTVFFNVFPILSFAHLLALAIPVSHRTTFPLGRSDLRLEE